MILTNYSDIFLSVWGILIDMEKQHTTETPTTTGTPRKTPGPKPSANKAKFSLMLPEHLYDWLLAAPDGASRRARNALSEAYAKEVGGESHDDNQRGVPLCAQHKTAQHERR
jgi:hypothetical protein